MSINQDDQTAAGDGKRQKKIPIRLGYQQLGNPSNSIVDAFRTMQANATSVPTARPSTVPASPQQTVAQRMVEFERMKRLTELEEEIVNASAKLKQVEHKLKASEKKIQFYTDHPDFENAEDLLAQQQLLSIQLQEELEILTTQLESAHELKNLEQNIFQREKELQDDLRTIVDSEGGMNLQVDNEGEKGADHESNLGSYSPPRIKKTPKRRRDDPPFDTLECESEDGIKSPSKSSSEMDGLISAIGRLAESMKNKEEKVIIKDNSDRKLPTFTGKAEDWVSFKGAFDRSTKKNKLDHQQNLARLMLSLKGTAKDAVKGLFNNPDNVPEIMNMLEKEFGSPKFIIESLIENVEKCAAPDFKKPETVKLFARAIRNLESSIDAHGMTDYANNGYLLKKIVDKLPTEMKERWLDWVFNGARTQDMQHFSVWMMHQYDKACEMHRVTITDDNEDDKKAKGKKSSRAFGAAASDDKENSSASCLHCNKKHHDIRRCYSFKKLSVDERWSVAKEKQLCYCCLKKGHGTAKCKEVKECGVDSCDRHHHPLLHKKKKSETAPVDNNQDGVQKRVPAKDGDSSGSDSVNVASSVDLLPVIPVIVHGPTGKKKIHALLDTGASFNMIESEVAKSVGLTGKPDPVNFTVFGGKRCEKDSQNMKIEISGVFTSAPKFIIESVNTIQKLGLPPRTFDAADLKRIHPHLKRMRARSMFNTRPQMVLGITELDLMAAREILETKSREDPIAVRCKLGWYVGEKKATFEKSFHLALQTDEDELHRLMKNFFSVEAFGVKVFSESQRSKDDRKALQILKETTVKREGRYETGLLFKSDNIEVPSTKSMALRRLRTMERKMDADAEFAKLCQEKFDDYINKGYLCPTKMEVEQRMYLPWFFSYHPSKKPRLVFDGAAKDGENGKCLNDLLLKGPDLLRPLATVLMRFRKHPVAITGDIKEMFHQVQLRKEDRPFQTILYRGMQRNLSPTEYEMTVLFFGSASSPCSAIYTKDFNAQQFQDKYPDAVKAIKLDHYVDDYCGCAKTEEEAIKLQQQITEIHAAGGFPIVKWNSNSNKVLEAIPAVIRAQPGATTFNEKSEIVTEKTLGLQWNPTSDEFGFKLNFRRVPEEVVNGSRHPTKREMASLVMSVYDPLGFLCPFRVRAMVILQNTWKTGIGWDDYLPDALFDDWKKWLEDLRSIVNVKIPRCYAVLKNESSNVTLHTFVDASTESYASSVYLRTETGGSTEISLVMGKCRVAPIKGETIPRMELLAAVMGTRLATTVKAALQDDMMIDKWYFWSDSKTVICWIKSTTARYNQFVGNRVGEILEQTDAADWHWVSTGDNVADDATRASKPVPMSSESRWITGPRFLLLPETHWFKEDKKKQMENVKTEDLEIKNVFATATPDDMLPLPNVENYSSWMRLIRSTAARFLAVRRFKKEEPCYIVPDDIDRAVLLWIKKVQADSFPDELSALHNGEPISKNSRLKLLSPCLRNGVIVLGGRINLAPDVEDSVKWPPILDDKHRYTKLLIQWYHRMNAHHGQETVINKLRQNVWITNCREAVRRCCAKCLLCNYRKAKPFIPMMGQLPVCRLGDVKRVFYHTGVDYFGPFTVTVNRRSQKRWGVLFTCLATRAVHLEVADSMDTSEMINAFTRFVAIRGAPAHLWSDNGTNFQGANREMKESLKTWNQSAISEHLTRKGVEWHFIPPAAPHMGGSWERLVGGVKKVLQGILNGQSMTDSRLRTLFCEVMDILNNRPITYASPDPEDPTCLTPNHFLKMQLTEGSSVPGIYDKKDVYRKNWRHVQQLADQFWKRWTTEYLPTLARREKWHTTSQKIKVGDVVLVLDDQAPRSTWKKGLITATYPAKDGHVRIVDVKVTNVRKEKGFPVTFTTYRRPVVKICPIQVISD